MALPFFITSLMPKFRIGLLKVCITYFNSHFCLLRCSYHIYRAELRKRIITPTLGYSFFNKYSGALAPFFSKKMVVFYLKE